jgi:predicted Zn-dependent protease
MAAVLAHEVGHVTGRHSVRQDAARKGSSVVTVLSVLTTGSTVIGDVTDLWGTAAVMGYGREMELEADGFGAEYLYNSGYNPKAMIEVIGVLKDQERFSRRLARESGKKTATYHGVFSTHPRNDQRLQEVVGKAVKLSEQQAGTDNKDTYRKHIEGMLYGINYQPKTAKTADRNTYAHSKLGFAVDFPEGWEVENQRNRIVAMAPDKHAEMTIEVDLLRQPVAPDDYIRDKLKIPMLRQSEAFKQFGLVGHKGLIPTIEGEEYPTRLAVLYQNRRIYVLKGKIHGPATEPTEAEKEAKEAEKASEQAKPPEEAKAEVKTDDELFVDTIHTFRPQRTIRRKATKSKSIHFVKANDRTSFAALAKHVQLGKYTEEQLRLLNGFYPRGEPEPGDWIKIVR